MVRHAGKGANRHFESQVPNGPLRESQPSRLWRGMADDFRRAFLRHIDEHRTSMADLARATGVSLDVLKKLKTRPTGSTTVENGLLIAAFYGKTVNQFVTGEPLSEDDRLQNLLSMLTPSERQLLEAQMLGLIASHGQK